MVVSLPLVSGCCQPELSLSRWQNHELGGQEIRPSTIMERAGEASWEEQGRHQPDALTSQTTQLARWNYRGGAGGRVYGRLCLVCQASRRYGVSVGHQTWWSGRQAEWELEESEDKLEFLWPSRSDYRQSNQGPLKSRHCCFPSAFQIAHL